MSNHASGSHSGSPERPGRTAMPLRIGIGVVVLCLLGGGLLLALPPGTPLHPLFFGADHRLTVEPASPGTPTSATTAAAVSSPAIPTSPPAGPQGDVIKIGADLPLDSIEFTASGSILNGAQLAIEQVNLAGGLTLGDKHYQLELYALGDTHNGVHSPEQGYENARTLVADAAVLAVLGPANTDVADVMMAVLNGAGLAQISPINTNVSLTKPEYGQTPKYRPSGKITYFRLPATDDLQGIVAADYLFDKRNVKNLYILDEEESYDQIIANVVEERFRERGGTVAGHETFPEGTSDFHPVFTRLAALQPPVDGLFYGGTLSGGLGLARKQMAEVGLNIPFMGDDGILEESFARVAGDAAEGTTATRAWMNAAALPEAAAFLAAYLARFSAEAGEYSAATYDATNIIIDAIRRAGRPDREAVRAAIAATDYQGVLGRTRFDANGDTTNRWISVFTVKEGHWVFADQLPVPDTNAAAPFTPTAPTPPSLVAESTVTPLPSNANGGQLSVRKIGLVADIGTITDHGINQAAWEGVQQAASALGAETSYIEIPNPQDYQEYIRDYTGGIELLAAGGYNPIVLVGGFPDEETIAAAQQHPASIFIGVNHQYSDPALHEEATHLNNYANLIFHEDRAGFLAGAFGGLMSKSHIVGAVLAANYPAVWRYGEGFRVGARYVQPDIKVQVVYHNEADLSRTFTDPLWGSETARKLMDQGADIIFGAGGVTGQGALEGAASRPPQSPTARPQAYAIGAEVDQYYGVASARPTLLSSAIKLVTPGLARLIQQAADGTLKPGDNYGDIGLAPFHDLDAQVPETIRVQLETIARGLNNGSIITGVPEMSP